MVVHHSDDFDGTHNFFKFTFGQSGLLNAVLALHLLCLQGQDSS